MVCGLDGEKGLVRCLNEKRIRKGLEYFAQTSLTPLQIYALYIPGICASLQVPRSLSLDNIKMDDVTFQLGHHDGTLGQIRAHLAFTLALW